MKIVCRLCGAIHESLIVDREIAWKEIQTKASLHLKNRHKEKFDAIALAIQAAHLALPMYIFNCEDSGCITIPEEETWIIEKVDYCQEIIMRAIGYEPEEIEDDEDEEEEEEEIEELEPGEIVLPDDGINDSNKIHEIVPVVDPKSAN